MKTVKDIMSTDCVTATTKDNIYELAVLMKQHDIGFVPIVEGKKLIGVVTDRDLVTRGYAEKHSGSTSATEVLTNDIKTIESSTSVDDAAKIMASNQIRRLPVVDNGNLIGVVAIGDLAVREIFVNEAGDALSSISEQDHRELASSTH
ncbi:CBS domain-containing protein [Paenibacillus oenotherae]|uniref:CBS domain-containing protein n=1 Tax=Paenibacillus oenotherae TaxID=1435645 RepID=A0ABS7D2N5_9BACL|nr:CBS domain-containing protein [Paenibacillus oenotherae]MBW7474194.1 CBS domain-containing protein [Paenibacillus oenotherae]